MPGSYGEREVTFEIVEEIGVISAHPTGWAKEINLVSWNGGQPKYDIREWSPAHDQMSRGITLNEKEMRLIIELLRRRARSYIRAHSAERGGSAPERRSTVSAGEGSSGHAGPKGRGDDWGPFEREPSSGPGERTDSAGSTETEEMLTADVEAGQGDDAGLTSEVAEDSLQPGDLSD